METTVARGAGIDVHQGTMVVSVRVPGPGGARQVTTQTFGTMTSDLLAIRDWLQSLGITHVAMESTGIYWRPLYYLLEEQFTVLLVNMQHREARAGPQERCARQRVAGAVAGMGTAAQ
jgi:transposase